MTLKLGVSRAVRRFAVLADLAQREPTPARGASTSLSGGLEYSFAAVRAGLFSARAGLTLGSRGKTIGVGGGWRVLGASLDYALRAPLAHGSRWSNAVSLSYRFGAWDPEAEYEKLLTSEMSYRRDLSQALRPRCQAEAGRGPAPPSRVD